MLEKHPHITTYDENKTWYAPCGGHHEANVGIVRERGTLVPSQLEGQIIEAAYQGIIQPDDNIALRIAFDDQYAVVAIEWPFFRAPRSSEVDERILKRLQESVKDLADFKHCCFLPLSEEAVRGVRNAGLYDELLIGHLDDSLPSDKFPYGKSRNVLHESPIALAEPERGLTAHNPEGIPKLPKK